MNGKVYIRGRNTGEPFLAPLNCGDTLSHPSVHLQCGEDPPNGRSRHSYPRKDPFVSKVKFFNSPDGPCGITAFASVFRLPPTKTV